MSALTNSDWALIVIFSLLGAYLLTLLLGHLVGSAWDNSDERVRNHPKANMGAINRDTRRVQRLVPSPRRSTGGLPVVVTALHSGKGGDAQQAAERRRRAARIVKDATQAALNDFASGKTTECQHARGTFGFEQWHMTYARVMQDQRIASAALLAANYAKPS